MAYATLADLKQYRPGASTSTTDDALLSACLTRAQAYIENECGRTFEASAALTRYYRPADVEDGRLYLDRDLLTVTTLTNGNGTVLGSATYVLEPRNSPPYKRIRLKSTYFWEFTDADSEISVAGTWGFSTVPPADIVQATIRLASFFYVGKDSQIFDVTASPEFGVITVPQGIPKDVKLILQARRKIGIGAI